MPRMDELPLLCEFLARVFASPPDEALIRSCQDGPARALLATLACDDTLRPPVRQMSQAVFAPRGEQTLARSYGLLFSGAGGPATVSPYASAHLEGRLFGNAAARMDGVLRELDLSIAADSNEPSDHLSIQLTVLAELHRRAGPAAARRFRDEQLLPWAQSFCAQCHAHDASGFYAAAAALLAGRICPDAPTASGGNR